MITSMITGPRALPRDVEPATPSFVIGLDPAGRWVALETHGQGGGLFISREAALHYARSECGGRTSSVTLSAEAVTLR